MLVTHFSSQIVEGDEYNLKAKLHRMAEARSVEVEIAYDSLEVILR